LVLEVLVLTLNVFDLGLESLELVLEGTECIFELFHSFLLDIVFISCTLGYSVVIISVLFFNAFQLYYHFLLAVILEQETFILQHFLQL
jgi:hypothetical protein